jgi:hypothetical protein
MFFFLKSFGSRISVKCPYKTKINNQTKHDNIKGSQISQKTISIINLNNKTKYDKYQRLTIIKMNLCIAIILLAIKYEIKKWHADLSTRLQIEQNLLPRTDIMY